MEHFYESLLINTTDGIQCKVYANSHPDGNIIVKPKYIPVDKANFVGLKKRYLFEKCMFRFNLFTNLADTSHNLKEFKEKFPEYFYESPAHKSWFNVVPKDKIEVVHDPKKGLAELRRVPEKDMDAYLKSVMEIVGLIEASGVPKDLIGINHSTLLGNYTPGKSDIDLVVYGKDNGWKAINYLTTAEHPSLEWKSEDGWRKYYRDRIVSTQFSEDEYVANMVQKKDDGLIGGNVFSIFVVEEADELWYDWDTENEPLGTVKIQAKVKDDYNSIVRPALYELEDSKILEGHDEVPVKKIITWSRPFVLQARKGDMIECVGLLEKVKPKNGEEYYQIVIGDFDTYTNERGEKEYLKKLLN
jgi:predicted nucleotidyltransferase